MKNQITLLKHAETLFLKKEYRSALRRYGLILKDYPAVDEAKVGVYLSDLGMQRDEEAQALFDYYQIIKDEKENAVEIIDGMLSNLDDVTYKLEEHLIDPLKEIDYGDGIRYSDFLELVESKGDFKETFENIMFSTKVIITNKDEFIDFVEHLYHEGFKEMALRYLDASSSLFGNDQDILALYCMLEGKNE